MKKKIAKIPIFTPDTLVLDGGYDGDTFPDDISYQFPPYAATNPPLLPVALGQPKKQTSDNDMFSSSSTSKKCEKTSFTGKSLQPLFDHAAAQKNRLCVDLKPVLTWEEWNSHVEKKTLFISSLSFDFVKQETSAIVRSYLELQINGVEWEKKKSNHLDPDDTVNGRFLRRHRIRGFTTFSRKPVFVHRLVQMDKEPYKGRFDVKNWYLSKTVETIVLWKAQGKLSQPPSQFFYPLPVQSIQYNPQQYVPYRQRPYQHYPYPPQQAMYPPKPQHQVMNPKLEQFAPHLHSQYPPYQQRHYPYPPQQAMYPPKEQYPPHQHRHYPPQSTNRQPKQPRKKRNDGQASLNKQLHERKSNENFVQEVVRDTHDFLEDEDELNFDIDDDSVGKTQEISSIDMSKIQNTIISAFGSDDGADDNKIEDKSSPIKIDIPLLDDDKEPPKPPDNVTELVEALVDSELMSGTAVKCGYCHEITRASDKDPLTYNDNREKFEKFSCSPCRESFEKGTGQSATWRPWKYDSSSDIVICFLCKKDHMYNFNSSGSSKSIECDGQCKKVICHASCWQLTKKPEFAHYLERWKVFSRCPDCPKIDADLNNDLTLTQQTPQASQEKKTENSEKQDEPREEVTENLTPKKRKIEDVENTTESEEDTKKQKTE